MGENSSNYKYLPCPILKLSDFSSSIKRASVKKLKAHKDFKGQMQRDWKNFKNRLFFWKKEEEEEEPKGPIVRYEPSCESGLTTEQVNDRVNNKLTNKAHIQTSKSYKSIFAKNIFTFFNLIWAIITVALCLVKAFNQLLFIFVVLANTAIAIIQEIRAKITVEKLSIQTLPHIKVLRDGQVVEMSSEDIVLDDIIMLSNGNQIPSDSIVVEGQVEVNESLLTGESNAIIKRPGDKLLSGSFIVSGACKAKVDKVGKENYIFQIAAKAREFKAPQSNLFKDINRLIKYIGIALIPIGILTFVKEFMSNNLKFYDQEVVVRTCGALEGMIPAGMFLLITMALAVGVVKLSRKKTLVRDLYSIEMLARTNVLCLDKTGTITDGSMNVVDFIACGKRRKSNVSEILSCILFNQKSTNATSAALTQEFGKSEKLLATNLIEFSSSRKYSVTEMGGKIYFLGAATFIKCKLDPEQKAFIEEQAAKGMRVIALSELKGVKFSENVSGENSTLIALIVLEEHIRKDAIETISWFKENGVAIKIISGDDPATVAKIAMRVGVENADKYVSLEGVSLQDVEKMAESFTVFGRVTPEQKYTLVKALKNKGNVVSMTGDGVNDTLALKEADCSIAMADGSEVARNISKLVLLDSNFSSLPTVVKEGRQVINNVQNSSALYLMKTFFTITLCLITLFFGQQYPFTPNMMLMIEMFVIGLPSFLMTFEPNTAQIKGNFIPQVMKKAIPRAMLMLAAVLLVVFLSSKASSPFTQAEVDTLYVLLLAYTGFLNLVTLCWPITIVKGIAVGASLSLLVIATCFVPELFSMNDFSFAVLISFFAVIICEIILMILIRLNRKTISKVKQKLIKVLQKSDEID